LPDGRGRDQVRLQKGGEKKIKSTFLSAGKKEKKGKVVGNVHLRKGEIGQEGGGERRVQFVYHYFVRSQEMREEREKHEQRGEQRRKRRLPVKILRRPEWRGEKGGTFIVVPFKKKEREGDRAVVASTSALREGKKAGRKKKNRRDFDKRRIEIEEGEEKGGTNDWGKERKEETRLTPRRPYPQERGKWPLQTGGGIISLFCNVARGGGEVVSRKGKEGRKRQKVRHPFPGLPHWKRKVEPRAAG